jgi:dnd system-associated protein 4
MSDRIRPPQDLESSVLDKLKDAGVFSTKQKGMMFAAALGYRLRGKDVRDVQLGKSGEGIRLEYFERPRDDGFIDALAVAATNELYVLADERQEERIELFEKYAAVGLLEMRKRLLDVPMQPLDAVIALLEDLKTRESGADEILPGLSNLI